MHTPHNDKHAAQQPKHILWIDYLEHKARARGCALALLEHMLRHATERYDDTQTRRLVVIGRHHRALVLIASEGLQGKSGSDWYFLTEDLCS